VKCLSDYRLECLAKGEGGLLRLLWRRHITRCETCRQKIEEIRANLALAEDLRATLRGGTGSRSAATKTG
jgi:hypothetical protein